MVWILTSEHNAYDQYGEYFEEVYKDKPTFEQLKITINDVSDEYLNHILNKGGRLEWEDIWYNLIEIPL